MNEKGKQNKVAVGFFLGARTSWATTWTTEAMKTMTNLRGEIIRLKGKGDLRT